MHKDGIGQTEVPISLLLLVGPRQEWGVFDSKSGRAVCSCRANTASNENEEANKCFISLMSVDCFSLPTRTSRNIDLGFALMWLDSLSCTGAWLCPIYSSTRCFGCSSRKGEAGKAQ